MNLTRCYEFSTDMDMFDELCQLARIILACAALFKMQIFFYPLKYFFRRLDSNDISQLDPFVFSALPSLRQLRLDVNRLSSIPQEALSRVNTLEVL